MSESLARIVECDGCAEEVELRDDGTYPQHRIGIFEPPELCGRSGKRYAFHMATFYVTERDASGKATEWIAQCRCGESWTGPDYRDVEALWAAHNQASQVERVA